MTQHNNFKVVIKDDLGNIKKALLSSGSVQIYQREQMQSYSQEHLKVSLIVMPSRRIEMRARMRNKFVDTTHALIKQTDPVKDPNDWLTRPDEQIVIKKKQKKTVERRHRVSKKKKLKVIKQSKLPQDPISRSRFWEDYLDE